MSRMSLGCFFFVSYIVKASPVLAFDQEEWRNDGERHAYSHAIIGPAYVAGVVGRITLLKRGNEVCGIQFDGFSRDRDKKPSSVFRSGEETFHAQYDQWVYGDGKPGIEHFRLLSKASIGIGRFILPSASRAWIDCGDIKKVRWQYPVYVATYSGSDRTDSVLIAPTAWIHFEDVDLGDPSLVWYGYDDTRAVLYISIKDLPGDRVGRE